jgi:hypothetical protein
MANLLAHPTGDSSVTEKPGSAASVPSSRVPQAAAQSRAACAMLVTVPILSGAQMGLGSRNCAGLTIGRRKSATVSQRDPVLRRHRKLEPH